MAVRRVKGVKGVEDETLGFFDLDCQIEG